MENTSVWEMPDSHEDDVIGTTSLFDRYMGVWIPGVLCITGFLGNVVSLLVLSLDRTKDPTFYSLRALALSDVILLITAFLQQVSNIMSSEFFSKYTKFACWQSKIKIMNIANMYNFCIIEKIT